jgi:large subunit ribosomal protein L47
LRIKSTEDLHKLWFVCVREKNLVLADELAKQHDPTYRLKGGKIIRAEKLDQTMRRIMFVINER